MQHKPVILPIFLSHMGCPHTCVFCNQHTIAGAPDIPDEATLVARCNAWQASSGRTPELAFYGGSFTALPADLQGHCLSLGAHLKEAGKVSAIRLSTRPDYLSEDTARSLKAQGVDCVEIGAQSFCDAVLQASGRGHDAECIGAAMKHIISAGLQCGVQLMVGLPEDTPAACLAGARKAVQLGAHCVRIYPTVVLAETALADAFRKGCFTPWLLETVVATAAGMLEIFEEAHIPVLRIGLQDVPGLHDANVLAGCHHPAMGELVRSRLWRRRLLALWRLEPDTDSFAVRVHPTMYSQVLGHGGCNRTYMKEKLGVELTVIPDDAMPVATIKKEGRLVSEIDRTTGI